MRLATLAGAGIAGAAAWSLPAVASHVPAVAGLLDIPLRIDAADAVAVTFDDGPHPEGTPAVLEALAEAGAVATFFVVGEQVRRYPSLVAETAAAGHRIALHGDTHRTHVRLAPHKFGEDLGRGHAAIAGATGGEPEIHRPPYGVYSAASLAIVRRAGYRSMLWSRWGHDWSDRQTPATIADEVTEHLGAGDVLLLHDADHYADPGSWRATAAALPIVLGRIEEHGLKTVLV
jgi:peptidoglycan/xylan/chitin deacetylase (PgdA/CDA1 family)